jgi:cation transport ATPase
MKVKNNQVAIVKWSLIIAGIMLVIMVLAFLDLEALPVHPAVMFLCVFLFLVAIVVALMFRGRSKKLKKLISGENIIASWTMSSEDIVAYADNLARHEKFKNKVMFGITTLFIFLIFGSFILFMEEGKGFMAIMMVGLIVILALFTFGMPGYYKNRNLKGDGHVLIGKNYAYVNGIFHNWDYPLSGLTKAWKLKKPFYGIGLVYYYTDRTLTNTEELFIPAPEEIDVDALINELKA